MPRKVLASIKPCLLWRSLRGETYQMQGDRVVTGIRVPRAQGLGFRRLTKPEKRVCRPGAQRAASLSS
jgi:hypothetical protein